MKKNPAEIGEQEKSPKKLKLTEKNKKNIYNEHKQWEKILFYKMDKYVKKKTRNIKYNKNFE